MSGGKKHENLSDSQAKTEFLENMRHDMRTPLTGIIGFAQLIQKEAVSEKVRGYADDLVLAATALLDFQNDILDAIRVSGNPINKQYFPLRSLVGKVIDLIKPKAIIKNLPIQLDYDATLPPLIYSDYKRLYRILLELITNALKFTSVGGIKIKISALSQTDELLNLSIAVSDSGVGIPFEQQANIFMRFKRLYASSDGVYEGTGLGLTMVKQFVEDLDGSIHVDSELGKGATFTCHIPIDCSKTNFLTIDNDGKNITAVNKEPDYFEQVEQKDIHILLVEDHPMTAKVTALILSDMGCSVNIAPNAASAMHKINVIAFDLLLIDIGLPDMNGVLLAEAIRSNQRYRNKKIPIIALTAHLDAQHVNENIYQYFDAIFEKPLLQSAVMDILTQYVLKMKTEYATIDLALGANRISQDEMAAKEMLFLLNKTLSQEADQFKFAFASQDWDKLSKLTHRLSGALSYCGAPQLEASCKALGSALKSNQLTHINHTFSDLQLAICALKDALFLIKE